MSLAAKLAVTDECGRVVGTPYITPISTVHAAIVGKSRSFGAPVASSRVACLMTS